MATQTEGGRGGLMSAVVAAGVALLPVSSGAEVLRMCYDRPPHLVDRQVFPTPVTGALLDLRRIAGVGFEVYHVCVQGESIVYCASGEPLVGGWFRTPRGQVYLVDLVAHRATVQRLARGAQ